MTTTASTAASSPARTTTKNARALARARREALYAVRAARDRRIDDGIVKALGAIARHAKLQAAEQELLAELGQALQGLAAEGLSRAEVTALTDLSDAQIRRYLAIAEQHRAVAPVPTQAGARDRALFLVGFVGALRRSELAALTLADLRPHPEGLVVTVARSKTNQTGEQAELVIVPRARDASYCPVAALEDWLRLAGLGPLPRTDDSREHENHGAPEEFAPQHDGAVALFQAVSKGNRPSGRPLRPESVNTLVQNAVARTGRPADGYSAHSLRAGFVTYAHLRGATDRAIAHQTRHRSMASLGQYIRIHSAWTDNAATQLL